MIASGSDPHLGNNGRADDSYEDGIIWMFESVMQYPVTDFVWTGDIIEGWQFNLDEVVSAKRLLLRRIDAILARRRVRLHIVKGNHDRYSAHEITRELNRVMVQTTVLPHETSCHLEGTHYFHGDLWDLWCRPGPLRYVATGLTWTVGVFERVIPGLDENALNPRNWFSAARSQRPKHHESIWAKAIQYAQRYGVRVCFGHLHRPEIQGRVVNSGCCINGRASWALLGNDGSINLIRKES